jgi:hypothetical protein
MAACIISTAQQANPKVSGHKDPARAQETIELNLVEIHSSFINISDSVGGIRKFVKIYEYSECDLRAEKFRKQNAVFF